MINANQQKIDGTCSFMKCYVHVLNFRRKKINVYSLKTYTELMQESHCPSLWICMNRNTWLCILYFCYYVQSTHILYYSLNVIFCLLFSSFIKCDSNFDIRHIFLFCLLHIHLILHLTFLQCMKERDY